MSAPHDGPSWAERSYRLLLRAYSRDYRARFAEAMCETFLLDHARVRAGGRRALLGLWIVTIAQSVWYGACERAHFSAVPTSTPSSPGFVGPVVAETRYAARLFARSPLFTATALSTLALCLGANLTIFAVIDSVLLRPLPFPEPDRLVVLFNTYPKAGKDRDGASITSYYERQGQIPAFSRIAALNEVTTIVGESGSTQRTEVGRVTAGFFATLGVTPALGRAFTEGEMTYQTDHAAILTDEFWRQHFDADPNVLGREVRSDGLPRTVVGVLPPGFRFLSSRARLFLPLSSEEVERNVGARHSGGTTQIARLAPGATLAEAQAEVDAHNAAHAAEFPYAAQVAETGFRTLVAPLHADHVASIRPMLLLLQAGVLFLLLIGAVNLVNLLLTRAGGRAKELAIRQSLGASRRQIVRQVVVETVLLTLTGGLLGLAVGSGGVRLLGVLGADLLPLGAHIAFDGRVALAALVGSIVLGFVLAVPVAWFSLRSGLPHTLKAESRGATASRAVQRVRHGFIVAQIASAFVLVAGASLLGLSLERVMSLPPGFRPDHVLTGQFNLPWNGYRDAASFMNFADRLLEEVGRHPGVSAAGVVTNVPVNGVRDTSPMIVVGHVPEPGAAVVLHPTFGVAGRYFAAMGIPLREGRYLDHSDSHREELTCVVDEAFARRYWPGGSAVGQQLYRGASIDDGEQPFTIVGVVGAVKQGSLTDASTSGAVYFPYSRYFARNYFLVARTALEPESLGASLARIVREIDPELPLDNIRSMETRISEGLVARRSPAVLAGLFAGMALLLAAVGTYGVLSFAVSQRRREIGVRMALGAAPKRIGRQFLGLGLRLLAAGTAVGVGGAWLAGRAMQSVLFGVPTVHPAALAGTAGLLGVVSLLACSIPAWRAARVDPQVALVAE